MNAYYCWTTLPIYVSEIGCCLEGALPRTAQLKKKTVKGWRERGTWRAAVTLRFDPAQLGSTGTPYRPCPVLRTRPKPFDPHFRRTEFPSGELRPRLRMKTNIVEQAADWNEHFCCVERLPILHYINILIKPDLESSCTIYQDVRKVSGKNSISNMLMKN